MSDEQNMPGPEGPNGTAISLERFAPEELVVCEACSRANSPKRSTCIYCGQELSGAAIEASVAPQPVTEAAPGSYFVSSDQLGRITEENANRIADLLQIKPVELQAALTARGPLPLSGTAMLKERPELIAEIEALGIPLIRVPPEVTDQQPLRKIRGLVLTEEALSAPPAENETVRSWLDLVLVVVGRIVRSRIEQEESRRRARTEARGLRHLSTDEVLMDLYFDSGDEGWRIQANNFDFSCLQNEKRVTVFENVAAVVNVIRERAVNAEIDDSFYRKRSVVTNVWPADPSSTSEWSPGIRQKFNYKTVTTLDNESQFNNYSRAAQFLRLKALTEGR